MTNQKSDPTRSMVLGFVKGCLEGMDEEATFVSKTSWNTDKIEVELTSGETYLIDATKEQ